MKILILNNLYKPFARGGAERVIETLAEACVAQGHEALVATSLPLGKRRPTGPDVHYFSGLPALFWHLDSLPKVFRLFYHLCGYVDPFAYWQTKKLLRTFQPDVIITNNLTGLGLSTLRPIKCSGAKHVHILHDIQLLHPSGLLMWGKEGLVRTWLAKRYQALNVALFDKTSLVVSPSRWLLDLHLECGLFKSAAQIVMANPAPFESNPRPLAPSSATIDCLSIGQLESHKGIGFLLSAFEQLPENFRLRIGGSGTLEREVVEAAKRNSRITYLGRLSPAQVESEMRRASLLIVPSLCYENSPTIIYEAMSQGLPVIAAKLGGIPELIADVQNLFIPGDQQSLLDTITGPYNRIQTLPEGKATTAEHYAHSLLEQIKAL